MYQSYTLDELCIFIRNGKSVKQSKDIDGLPITRIETIANQVIDSDRVGYAGLTEDEGKSHLLENGDILFSHINSLEHLCKTAIYEGIPEKLVHGMNLLCIRPNPQLIFPQYFLHLLRSSRIKTSLLQFANKSVNQASISAGNLKSFKVNIPPLSEQRRIASILDKADELRQKRQQAIEKLDQLLQATFIDMFGDPVSNPKGWQKDELQNICMQVIDCPHSTPTWSDEGIICLRTSNLGKGEWIWDDTRYVSPLEYIERTKRSEIFAGDIILSREGTVGIAAIVPNDLKLSLGQRLVQLTPKLDKVNSEFLLQVLLYDLDPIRISSLMVGSTSKHINVKDLRGLKLFVPPIELQNKFSSISLKISQQKKELKTSLSNFDNLFKALQNQTFSRNL